MKIRTTGLNADGSSILLLLALSEQVLAEQARIAAAVPGQLSICALHVTLMPSTVPGKSLPALTLPPSVELSNQASLVTQDGKTSVFLSLTSESQQELAQLVAILENELGISDPYSGRRIFHVSLTNLVGAPTESVAHIWEYSSKPV